jgi:nucleotide-binding universal stress UspA family protein
VLPAAVKRSNAELIVLGLEQSPSPLNWLRGGLPKRVARRADVPLLVVRESESLITWARGERPLRILVAYDFSASADAALHWVAALRGISDCEVVLAYVSWPPNETMRFGIGGDTSIPGNSAEVQELLESDLARICRSVLGDKSVKILSVANWSREHAKIIELAGSEQADLIVVGNSRRGGLDRFWLGSVSRGLLRSAPINIACVPVTAVNVTFATPSRTTGTFERVLIPTDLSPSGDRAVARAFKAVKSGGEVCLLHVVRPAPVFGMSPDRRRRRGSSTRRSVSRKLKARVPSEAAEQGVRYRVEIVEHEHPSIAICQAAERFRADLICLGSRQNSSWKKKLFGSTAKSVMRRSSRPVLVVRT